MGVGSIGGQDPAALLSLNAARTRRSPPGTDDVEARDASAPARAGPEPSEKQVREAAKVVEQALAAQGNGVRLRIDNTLNRVVAQIVDQNNQVIKQIPPEEMLRIAAKVREMSGLLFNEET